jgi:flagellar basal body P-ring formation protein FlgA
MPAVLLTTLLALAASRAGAVEIEPLTRIAAVAEDAVRNLLPADASVTAARYEVTATMPDSRLRLAACEQAPHAMLAPGTAAAARTIVQVRCDAPVAWSIQLPVRVETDMDVLVAQRPLPRGARPGAADVATQRRRVAGVSAEYVNSLTQLEGYHLVRPIPVGTALTLGALQSDPVIRRGEIVTLVTSSGSFEVKAPGRALADAGTGERVRIQNLASQKVVEGRVERSGAVRVDW